MNRDPAELDRISDMLRARISDLVHGVWGLKNGFQEGNDWVCPNPLRVDRTSKSFRIAVAGPLQGLVKDFAGPFGSVGKECMSALTFHAELMCGGDVGRAIKWAKAWLGLDGADPAALRTTRAAVQSYHERPVQDEAAVAKRRASAQRTYLAGGPILGTPGWLYFRDRGLDLSRLSGAAWGALRFNPKTFCGEKQAEIPAVVMAINGMDGQFLGVHRLWIDRDRDGRWVKYPGIKSKKAFGAYAGGTIRLWNGQRVLEKTGEVVYGRDFAKERGPMRIHMTEGPEDAIAVALALPDERVHCAVSVSNWKGIAYPEKVSEVVLWRQNDPPGSPAAQLFESAMKNFHDQGKRVLVADVTSVMPGVKDPAEAMQRGES